MSLRRAGSVRFRVRADLPALVRWPLEALGEGEESHASGDVAGDGCIRMRLGQAMTKLDLLKRLNEWSRWDSLRKLGSSPMVRSSLAFAAAGYLLLWNAKFQDFLTIKFDAPHFSLWRIWMIY
jgi:hypothetical protein